VARMREGRGLHGVLVGKPEGKRLLGRPRRRWEDNIGSVLLTQYCAGGKFEKNKMGEACGAYGVGKRCAQGSGDET
jgi:hypothetical protein